MPKMLSLAFALSFIVSVGLSQGPDGPQVKDVVAELDKKIVELKAKGAKGNFRKMTREYQVTTVASDNAAIIEGWHLEARGPIFKDGLFMQRPALRVETTYYMTGETKGFIDGKSYKLTLAPSGETKTYPTMNGGQKTVEELVRVSGSELELEQSLYETTKLAARMSYKKLKEELAKSSFYLYKQEGKKKIKLHKFKVTLTKAGDLNNAYAFVDRKGEVVKVNGKDLSPITMKKIQPGIEQEASIQKKYGVGYYEAMQ